jgi:phosphoribosylanthranilate isomerase
MPEKCQMAKIAVKICGITNLKDATIAVDLGADALGFIFAHSPRQITPQKARDIIDTIPPLVKTVGVFVNRGQAAIEEIIHYCGLDLVQLHGDEPPIFCHAFMPCTIKALRIKDESSLHSIQTYHGNVRALLLDAYSKEKVGGTGKTFDWELALRIKKLGIPIILSGGLGPSNIVRAISSVKPYAVDVNSGVEEHPGKKSHNLIRDLMKKVKLWTGELRDD